MRKLVVRLFAALVLLWVILAPLSAQTTGSIRGVVETSHTALPGVTVEAKSPNLQGTRSAVTDAEGRFNLTSLPPGKYTVTARLEGFAPRVETLQLALTQAAVLNIEITPAATAEVTVTSQAVPVETESNAIGRNLDAKAFQALPTGRNYADVTQLASGVNTDNSNVRQQSFTVYGSTGLENAYMVDGANTTGVEIGAQGKVLNFEFIQEVELKAGGYEAEYTGAQGGILNVVTKSGGNEYHGDVFGYFDNDGLQADNKHLCLEGTGTFPNCTIQETPDGIPVGFTKQDYGVDVGGFILKDSLWFFGAYDHVRNTLQRQVTTGETAGTQADLDTTSNLYSAKLTWNFGQGQTLVGSVFGDPTNDTGAVGQLFGPPTTYDGTVSVGGTDFGARYQGILGPKWLVTGQFFYHREKANTLPGLGGNEPPVIDATGGTGIATGGFVGPQGDGQFALKTFTRYDYLADATYYVGSHNLKAGFGFQRIDGDVVRDQSGGQLVNVLGTTDQGQTIYSHTFFASPEATIENPTLAPVVATPQNDVFAVYVQDRWEILHNLTVNAGVRWEKQEIKGLGGITYININHFSPRVGVTWDFLNNGRSKAYASYSEFVPMIPMDMNVRSLNGERDGYTQNFSQTDLACDTEAFPDDCIIRGKLVDDIDPNLKSPYSKEILAGVEVQLGTSWGVGVKGIYRALGRVLEDTCVPVDVCDNYAFINPGSSTVVPCPDDFEFTCYNGQAFPAGKRYFRGVEFTAQKNLSDRWSLFASYLYGTLEGNFDGNFRAIGGFFSRNPNITDDFDYPAFQNNAYGNLTLDRRNQAKLQAAYFLPFGLTMSVSGFWENGTPLSRLGWWDAYSQAELFLSTRGTNGHTPDLYEMDLQADYGLQLGPVTVHILASLFNVLNRQQTQQVDQRWSLLQDNNDLPEPTNTSYLQGTQWQQPRTLRLGVRVSF
jgi:hypothetical protein